MSNDNKPNISVTGGPGKPHTSDDTRSTSSTGGTGGMGFSGGTGASGLGGEVGKALRTQDNNNDWTKWISAKLPNLKKRSREKYMNIAGVPMVETHLEYGVERLAEFGSFYASKSDEEQKTMKPDPFNKYLKKFNVRIGTTYDERREHIDAVLEVSKLERLGMEFPLEVMLSFLRVQDALTGDDEPVLFFCPTQIACAGSCAKSSGGISFRDF